MQTLRRTTIGLVAAGSMLALGASSAGAVTTVGSDFASTPDTPITVGSTLTQGTKPTAGTLPVTSPTTGVIVRIRAKHGAAGAAPGNYGFRVLSGAPESYTSKAAPAELPDFAWPANDPAGVRTFQPQSNNIPKGIEINAGERLAITRASGTPAEGPNLFANAGATGASLSTLATPLTPGTAQTFTASADQEVTLQFDVEPDGDKDKFGDETQDNCVGKAGDVRGCPPAPKKAKKCKKAKKKKGTASAPKKGKKKCKKKGKGKAKKPTA